MSANFLIGLNAHSFFWDRVTNVENGVGGQLSRDALNRTNEATLALIPP